MARAGGRSVRRVELGVSDGRIWAVPACPYEPCATSRASISDDAGLHWRGPVASRRRGRVVGPRDISYDGLLGVIAGISRGIAARDHSRRGRLVAYSPSPCSGTPYLARNASVLLLVCAFEGGEGNEPKTVWASDDDGHTWRAVSRSADLVTPPVTTSAPVTLAVRGNVVSVTTVGDAFVIAENRGSPMVSVDGGRSWQEAIAMGEGFSVTDVVPRVGIFLASGPRPNMPASGSAPMASTGSGEPQRPAPEPAPRYRANSCFRVVFKCNDRARLHRFGSLDDCKCNERAVWPVVHRDRCK